ncbi:InlB B-repeat-containing protein [Treponema vincentii]|uniref:InlB B-repeat-containing protein n=1 Tax=Treponema vincentii TaxID=69710 RepID=UPI0035F59D68
MRKAFIILTGMLFTLLFATCTQFTADIDGYLSYWSSEAYITDSSIKAVLQNDVNSIPSVPSVEDVSVTFKLKNPKSFSLDLPPAAAPAKKVIVFEHLTQAPVVGTDYTLTQSEDRQSLTLTYKASFLQAYEWGAQDLSSTLSLYAVDGRPFKQTYTLKLKANTPPQNPSFTVAKTTGSPAYYVLCITIPDMDKRVPGGLLHKDLARIEVNGTPYTFSVNEAQTAFTKPEADVFITHSAVEKLNEPDADDVPADSSWVLYYKTDVEVKDGAAKKDYTIKLIDERGLASDILNASTKPNKAEAENITITKGTKISGSGSEADPIIIGTGSAGAELTASSPTANTTVHCTVSEIGGSTPVKYDGNPVTVPLPLNGAGEKKYKLEYYTDGEGLAATPVQTVYYKVVQGHTVSFDANTGAYPDGTTAVSKIALHGATVSAPDPLPKKQGFGVTGWYKDKACSAGQAWNFATDTVTGNITLYAQWTAGADTPYKVKHYLQKFDDSYLAEPILTENLTGTTGAAIAVTQKNYEGFEFDRQDPSPATIAADGSTVVKVYYKRKIISVTFDLNGGNIGGNLSNVTKTGKYGAAFTAPANLDKTGYTFSSWQPVGDAPALSLTFPAKNAEYKANWTANTYTVRFSVYGGTGGTLKAKPEGSTEKTTRTTGTVSVEHGKKVDFTAKPDEGYEVDSWTGATADTPNTTATLSNVTTDNINVIVKFRKKVYEVRFSVAAGEGQLKGEGGGYIDMATGNTFVTLTVPHGGNVDFTATPATSGSWEVGEWSNNVTVDLSDNKKARLSNVTADTTVTVTFYQSEMTDTPSSITEWRDLLSAVRNAPANATIKINGEINATPDSGNNGEILIDKNLTIKGKKTDGSDTLNAITLSRIFKVKTGNTLALENITLKNGGKYPATEDGGGIYSEGTLTLKNTTIKSCGATKGGAIFAKGATVKITNCTLIGNKADTDGCAVYAEKNGDAAAHITIEGGAIKNNTAENDWGSGGGIYINDGCTLTLDTYNNTGTEISGNKAGHGGGVQAINSTVTMTKCTITGNHATKKQGGQGGGVSTDGGKLTMTGCFITENTVPKAAEGGGMAIKNTTVIMTNCTIENNKIDVASSGFGYGSGGGVCVTGGSFTMTGGTIKGNEAFNGSGVCVSGGSFEMSGVHIENNNTVPNDGRGSGGGVYLTGGSFKMSSGTIKGNKAQNNTGGGVCVTGGSFTMTGGEISGNTASQGGSGVYVNGNATFTMYGGTITGNTGGKGKGVYLENSSSKFVMGKEACVGKWKNDGTLEDGNEVYLRPNAIIRIDKDKPITKSKVAHISPHDYDNGRLVLVMTEGTTGSTTVADHNDKFTVQPNAYNWEVGNDGKLHAK